MKGHLPLSRKGTKEHKEIPSCPLLSSRLPGKKSTANTL
jgi:hypothetical protein